MRIAAMLTIRITPANNFQDIGRDDPFGPHWWWAAALTFRTFQATV